MFAFTFINKPKNQNIMKKIITITILLLAGLMVSAQNPFLKDGDNVYLKVQTDKTGIGTAPTADKLSVGSVAGETTLGLKGYPNHYNPYITLYNSNSVAIWKLFASADYFAIGTTMDTTNALLIGRATKGWLKVNGTGSFTKLISTTGTITTFGSTTATVTHLETTDTTGIVLYNRAGTKYRLYISSNGTVKVSTVP